MHKMTMERALAGAISRQEGHREKGIMHQFPDPPHEILYKKNDKLT
jgi:hypothetical protein